MDILEAVAEGKEKPTHIMYRANLSWTRLQEYLGFLLRQDLIKKKRGNDSKTFSITSKGKDVLRYFNRIQNELLHDKKRTIPTEAYVHIK